MSREARRLVFVGLVRTALNDETSAAEHFRADNAIRQVTVELARQIAHWLAHTHQNRFASLIYFPAGVIQRVHRCIREDEKVTVRSEASENVFQHAGKIVKVNGGVRQQQKLRERELSFPKNSK